MKNLILKIKNYQEDTTYVTLSVPSNLSNIQIIELGKDIKRIIDTAVGSDVHTPNIIRYENNDGIFNGELHQLVAYK